MIGKLKLNFEYFCVVTVNLVSQPVPGRYRCEPDGKVVLTGSRFSDALYRNSL